MLSTLGISGFYFWSIIHSGPHDGSFHSGGLLLGTIIALVVAHVVLISAVAILAPKEAQAPHDERDALIDLRSMRVAYSALATAVVFACFFGAMNPPLVFDTNALLFILVSTEVLRSACRIVQYRRGV